MSKEKIAFASCVNKVNFPEQRAWDDVAAQDPDYLFLLGDNIYMDYFRLFFYFLNKEHLGKPEGYDLQKFGQIMEAKYEAQWNERYFKKLLAKMDGKVFGTWDDHDFAWNNAWGNQVDPQIKAKARALFNKYMKIPTNQPEIYCYKDIEHARVIFLDNRSYADNPEKFGAKMLGDVQFDFLAQNLNHDKRYTIICAGLTLTYGTDNWAEFSGEYSRFCRLVEGRKDVIFLAGDIHTNKFGTPAPETFFRARRPCYEIISSGIALNTLGLPFKINDQHNWGLLELDEDEIIVHLYNKKSKNSYRIDGKTWMSDEI